MFPTLLAAAWLLCACTSMITSPSSSNLGSSALSNASISHPQSNAFQKEITYTETDVQAAFVGSDSAPNGTSLDCVVAEDQVVNLMGVVHFLDSEHPKTCWLGFVTTDGIVYSAGPKA